MNAISMNFTVLLSVYIKEYSGYLKLSLESIFDQTLQPNEVVIVKDGPLTKELDQVIRDFQELYSVIKVVSLSENVGLGKALNVGLGYCSNEIIARMDTDDICKSHRFETQIQIFKNDSSLDVVGAWIDEFSGSLNNIISVRKLPQYHDDIVRFAKMRNPVNHPVVMFKKSAVIAVGGYQHFPFFEDYYLWVRMLSQGKKIYNCQESLLYFRFSESMISRRKGFKYALVENSLLREFVQLGFMSVLEYLTFSPIKFLSRILPLQMFKFAYLKLLR